MKIISMTGVTLILLFAACREELVSKSDADKERLIVGSWVLSHIEPEPENPVSIQLVFRPDFTLRVIKATTDSSSDDEYGYVIANGQIIYFVQESEGILGVIESIDRFHLVILITSSQGQPFREIFNRIL